MRTYEVLFILNPQTAEEETQNLIGDFRKIAESGGAKLVSEDAWGRRRLAYPIHKLNEGVYHLFTFEAEAESLSELDRKMKNSDVVVRHLISRTDEDMQRAIKLAKKNPKKERRPRPEAGVEGVPRPAAPAASAPMSALASDTPAANAPEATTPEAEATTPEAEATTPEPTTPDPTTPAAE
jgi:small subunit ribosomal protein S6